MKDTEVANSKTRVLVVEDEADIRRILKDLLEAQGFYVVDLSSGHAILHQIELHHPDVLLVDQMMPGITGVVKTDAMQTYRLSW